MDREVIRRRNLPHWDMPGAPFFVTTCLEGSIPAQGLLEIDRFRLKLRKQPPAKNIRPNHWRVHCWKLCFARMEKWQDHQPGRRDLQNPKLAQVVVDSFFHFAAKRYDLLAYVVMASHVHWLFRPLPDWVETLSDSRRTPRERITYSLNRFTATQCNRILNRNGQLWQNESYDHWVRDADELERIIRYIEDNPVKAGLVDKPEDWLFSSARTRTITGTEWGMPLIKPMSGLES
jgi:REP-associated tyrosine transposase